MAETRTADRISAVIRDVTGSMIAVGKNIVQINLTFNLHGIPLFRMPAALRPQPHLRPLPIKPPPPRRFLDLLDREAEIGAASASLQSTTPTQVYGPSGIGKTVLLQHLAYQEVAARFPDGIVYYSPLSSVHTPADLLQDLFNALYEFPEPAPGPLKPSDAILRQWMRDRQALVMLNRVELSRDQAEGLLEAAPGCTFVLASTARSLWGEARAIELGGLSLDAALRLLERRGLERPLQDPERAAAEALCTALDGHPLSILQAASLVRTQRRTLEEVAAALKNERQGLAKEIHATLNEKERTALALLTALRGAAVGVEHIGAITQTPDVEQVLDNLRLRYLVRAHSPRYSAALPAEGIIPEDVVSAWADRAVSFFVRWTEEHRAAPSLILQEIDAILSLLRWAVGAEHWPEVARLARASDGGLALSLRWGGWSQVLNWAYEAARRLGDRSLEAWALHQRGSQALCLDDPVEAKRALGEALMIREALGDEVGAAVTRHNLDLLLGPPPLKGPDEPRHPPTPPRTPLAKALLVALAALALTVGGVTARNRLMQPMLGTSVSDVDFKSQEVGTLSDPVQIELHNTGRSRLRISDVELKGAHSNDFRLTPGSCLAGPISPRDACKLTIVFAPGNPGVRRATLRINHNAGGSPREIPLSGTAAIPIAALTPHPASLRFGEQMVGRFGAPRQVVLENVGGGLLAIQRVEVAGLHADDFRITQNRCTDARLVPHRPCPFAVVFGPVSQGDRTSQLVITHNGSNSPTRVALSGRGVILGVLRVSPRNLDFGAVSVDQASPAHRVALQNRGQGLLTVTGIERSGAHSGDFLVRGACTRPIAPGAECVLSVSFVPSAEGVRSARLLITSSVGSTSMDLRGAGQRPLVASLEVAPGAAEFGDVLLGAPPATRTVRLSNSGSEPVTIRGISVTGTAFAIIHQCIGTLSVGASCEITVTFQPLSEGRSLGTIRITHSAGLRVVEISGTARIASVRILGFLPEPREITGGQGARLCWEIVNARSGRIDPDDIMLETREISKGCREVRPERTTQYTLIVAGWDGREISRSTTVLVRQLLQIRQLTAAPSVIAPGSGASLCWSVVNADRVHIEPDVGDVDPRYFEKGCAKISPRQTTIYTLRATGSGGQMEERRFTVSVSITAVAVEIRGFMANPDTVPGGGTSVLCWSVINAERARIDPIVGELDPREFMKGCTRVSVKQTTTYTLTATDSKGLVVNRQVTVSTELGSAGLPAPRPISPGSSNVGEPFRLYPCGAVLSWAPIEASVAIEYQVVLQRQNPSTHQWETISVPATRETRLDVTKWLAAGTIYGWSVMGVDPSSGRRSPASQFLYIVCLIG